MKRRSYNDENGLTLVELMVTVVMVGLIIVAIPAHFRSGTGIWEKGERHAEVTQNALIGMEQINRELKQSQSITAISGSGSDNGDIKFENVGGNAAEFRFNSEEEDAYLRHDNGAGTLNRLSGPLTSLKFAGYRADDVTETADPKYIKSVLIKMDTHDSQELADDVPLASRVYIGDLLTSGEGEEFAIFGSAGVYFKNNNYVSGNVGSNGTYDPDNPNEGGIYFRQNTEIDGGIYFAPSDEEDGIDYQGSGNSINGGLYPNVYTELPCPTDFGGFSYGTDVTVPASGTMDLPPSTSLYRELTIENKGTVVFNAGQYYFKKINAVQNATFIYNLASGASIEIFVKEDIYIGNNLETGLVESGTPGADLELAARKIYFETHYQNPALEYPAFILSKANDPLKPWVGTVYAVYDDIGFITGEGGGSGLNDVIAYGSFYSGVTLLDPPSDIDDDGDLDYAYGGHVYMETNCEVYYVRSEYFSSLPYGCNLE